MHQFSRTFLALTTVMAFYTSCATAQPPFYAYTVNIYTTDTGRHLISRDGIISYKDYVIEFRMSQNTLSEYILDKEEGTRELKSSITTYDTIGLYLIYNKRYFEFDTFALQGKLLKTGPLGEKSDGYKLGEGKLSYTYAPPKVGIAKDTVMGGIHCFYANVLQDNGADTGKFLIRLVLFKLKHLNSLHKAYGANWHNDEFCVMGMMAQDKASKDGYVEEVADLRPLTAAERKICESLIQKAGLPLPK